MTYRLERHLATALALLALAACADSPTEPGTAPTESIAPELAVASNSWSTRAPMPTARWGLATAADSNPAGQSIVYAIGGTTATGGSLSKVQAYNVATNAWTTKAPIPVPLYRTNGAGAIRGKIYVSGGLVSNGNVLASLYEYDPVRNTWTRKRDMPKPTYDGVTGVINNKLYVVSGCNIDPCGPSIYRVLYRYDPLTNLWTTLASPSYSHLAGMGGVIGGKLYATRGGDGGSSQTDFKLDVYNPTTNTWAAKAPMARERWGGAGATLAGKLYVFGGYQRQPDHTTITVNTTSVYDPATDTWTNKSPMPKTQAQLSASRVFLNGQPRIMVVGGGSPDNNLAYIP
jgi:N-acetylneuraminic acid mutarotase